VSNYGRVKSQKNDASNNQPYWYYLKPSIKYSKNKLKMESVGIYISCSNNKTKSVPIKRLVAKYFIPEYIEELQVWNKDGDKLNNHVNNLILMSQETASEFMKTNQLYQEKSAKIFGDHQPPMASQPGA
jgi:hypothetical protein